MNPAVTIQDIILHKSAYSTQIMIVLDRMPELKYERDGNRFTAEDSGFYDFLQKQGESGDAFGGRKFDIQLKDGSTFNCHGQVWSVGPPKGLPPLVQVGISTRENLSKCYVFSGGMVRKDLVADWLSKNVPSFSYYKYDSRRNGASSRFDFIKAHGRKVGKQRARKLRQRGVTVVDGRWSKFAERLIAEDRRAIENEQESVRLWNADRDIPALLGAMQ